MANIVLYRQWVQGQPVQIDNLIGEMFNGENLAHTFEIHGVDASGETVAIQGQISGKFITAEGTTIPLSGTITSGVASITLTSACYGVPGRFIFSVYSTYGGATTCIYAGVGNVFRTSTAQIGYPTTAIPDLVELINDVQDAIDSVPADYSALLAAIAPTFNASTNYSQGTYVWHIGKLYRFTTAHSASAFSGEDCVEITVGGELRNANVAIAQNSSLISTANSQIVDARARISTLEDGAVRYDIAQNSLTDAQKLQARNNIGVGTGLAEVYSASKTYAVGDYVLYNGTLYRCTTAITTAEAWNSAHWTAAVMGNDVTDLKSALVSVKTDFATAIESGTDLNAVITPGNYKVVTVAIASTLLHAPTTLRSYRMIVFESTERAVIIQIAITNDTANGGDMYIRHYQSNTWTDWHKYVKDNDLSPVTNALLKVFNFNAENATIIENSTDLNTITTTGNYKVTSNENARTMLNCPVDVAFSLKVSNISTLSTQCQIIIPNAPSTGGIWYRLSVSQTWHKLTDDRNTIVHKNVVLTASNYLTYLPNGSFNDAEPNSIYGINETTVGLISDGPVGNGVTGQPQNQSEPDSPPATMGIRRGTLLTFSQMQNSIAASGLVQIFVGYREIGYYPTFAYRIAVYSNGAYSWSDWAKFEENGYLHAGNQIVFGGQPYIQNAPFMDLNNAPGNSIYHIDKNMDGSDADHTLAHHPAPGSSSIVITYSFSYTTPHARMQMVCSLDRRMYWRYGYLQASNDYRWTAWNNVAMDDGDILRNKGRLDNATDLNTILTNSIYLLGGQASAQYGNNPLTSGAGYLTVKATNDVILQVVEALSGERYSRYSDNSGSTFSNWRT